MTGNPANAGVILAGEDAAAGLDFGNSGDQGGVLVGARATCRKDTAGEPRGLDEIPSLEQLGDRRGDCGALF